MNCSLLAICISVGNKQMFDLVLSTFGSNLDVEFGYSLLKQAGPMVTK